MPGGLDSRALARLRWRCRRGMLENDLVLERFLALRGDTLTQDEVAMLDRLLELPDNELWDLIVGRTASADPDVAPLVSALVATPAAPDRSRTTKERR